MCFGAGWTLVGFLPGQRDRFDDFLACFGRMNHFIHHLGAPAFGHTENIHFFPGTIQIALIGVFIDSYAVDLSVIQPGRLDRQG